MAGMVTGVLRIVCALSLSCLTGQVPLLSSGASSQVDVESRLFRYVLSGASDWPGAPLLITDPRLPLELRVSLQEFRSRTRQVRSRLTPPPGGPDEDGKDGFFARQSIERAIVALFNVRDIEQQAMAYAKAAVTCYEYEGWPDCALEEAAHAERHLRQFPKTPLAPYLHLYLASRYRVAFEAQAFRGDLNGQASSARQYRVYLERARNASHPLLRAATDDLDRASFVYMELPTRPHPRTFTP